MSHVPVVDFSTYVNEPGTRIPTRRLTQREAAEAKPAIVLTMDAIGVRAKCGDHDVTYPWGVISQASNVPRAK